MANYQIGTEESKGCTGSRKAKATTLEQARLECAEYSRYRFVKSAWLREWVDGGLGPVIVVYVKGKEVI